MSGSQLRLQNFKCSGTKHVMFDTKLGHSFFVTCPRLGATDGMLAT